jgi:uncharacterized membrane protein
MNPAQLHLIFTHLPIIGLGFAILFNLIAVLKKSEELQQLALWFYILLGVFALLAYLTGDNAAEVMKTYPGITEDIIEPHENFALFFFIGLMVTTAFSMAALYITKTKRNLLGRFSLYLLIAALLISLLALKTGSTGGAIRHTEIKEGIYKKGN